MDSINIFFQCNNDEKVKATLSYRGGAQFFQIKAEDSFICHFVFKLNKPTIDEKSSIIRYTHFQDGYRISLVNPSQMEWQLIHEVKIALIYFNIV